MKLGVLGTGMVGIAIGTKLPRAALPEGQRDVDSYRLAVGRNRRPFHAAALRLPTTSRTSPMSPLGPSRTSTPCIRTSPLDQQLHDPRLPL